MGEDSSDMAGKSAVETVALPLPVEHCEPSVSGAVAPCCVSTIRHHVRYNPMMVCSHCKFIIKCFTDERAYQNYLIFCRSRRRPVVTGVVDGYYTCAFRSYDTFSR